MELLNKEKELNDKLVQSIGQVKILIEESPYTVALFDNEGKYLHLNTKLSNFNGYPIEFHIGKKPGDLFNESGKIVDEIIRKIQFSKASLTDFVIETTPPAYPNEVRIYCLQFYPVQLHSTRDPPVKKRFNTALLIN